MAEGNKKLGEKINLKSSLTTPRTKDLDNTVVQDFFFCCQKHSVALRNPLQYVVYLQPNYYPSYTLHMHGKLKNFKKIENHIQR